MEFILGSSDPVPSSFSHGNFSACLCCSFFFIHFAHSRILLFPFRIALSHSLFSVYFIVQFLFLLHFPFPFPSPATRLPFFVFHRQREYCVVNFTHRAESLLGRSPWRFEGINIFTNWGYGRPRVRNYLYFLCINVPAKLIQNVLHSRVSCVILLEIALSCKLQHEPE